MATNLLDVANSLLTSDVVSKVSSVIGETPAKTAQALGMAVPSIAGIACNEASTPGGASKLFSLISSTKFPDNLHSNLAGLLSGGAVTDGVLKTGSTLVSSVLGDRAGGVANLIANASGIRFASASTLLNLVASLFFGVLGRHLTTAGITASGLSSFLTSHRDSVQRGIPEGLGTALGLNHNTDICGAAPVPSMRPVAVAEPVKKGLPVWWWLIPLLLLLAAFLWWRSCNAPTGPKMASISLPCGTVLSVEEGYFTFNLANFMLKGSDSELPKTFVFDHLNFDSATTNLTPESKPTVTDLIAIMKCYPTMNVKLEGHTDSTGDPEANKKLSLDRADAVKALLVAGGIDGGRIDTAGWGQEKPIASNDTEEGKAKNRRTELTVVKK